MERTGHTEPALDFPALMSAGPKAQRPKGPNRPALDDPLGEKLQVFLANRNPVQARYLHWIALAPSAQAVSAAHQANRRISQDFRCSQQRSPLAKSLQNANVNVRSA